MNASVMQYLIVKFEYPIIKFYENLSNMFVNVILTFEH